MKKKILLLSIPFVLLAVFFSHGFLPFLLLPIIILFVNYLVDRKESNPVVQEMKGRLFHSVEEVELEYGKPDSVVVLNATKANEISDVVLSYPERGCSTTFLCLLQSFLFYVHQRRNHKHDAEQCNDYNAGLKQNVKTGAVVRPQPVSKT